MSNAVFKIECVVRYDETSVDEGFENALQKSVDRAIQHGMLSPTGEEIVDEYSMEIQHAKSELVTEDE